ncbi:MAG: IS110 family transposase [Oscillospiraceae bacterium]|nr:IS110 family transposase [Oscillospiraceae bacterium]
MALKIVYPVCCGMDVHKSFVIACIAATDNKGVTSYKKRRFSTFTGDLRLLAQWLSDNNCADVCMESTGKYWIPVYNILEPTCNVVLAHPKYVKAIRGKKTDQRDAKWIADIFKHDLVAGSFIPSADIRQLRDLMRYRVKLTSFMTGEKNRLQNCLTVSNIKLDDVFSSVFGKSAAAITDQLILHPDGNFDVAPFIDGRCKAPPDKVQAAVDGVICPGQVSKLGVIRSHMDALSSCRNNLESVIFAIAEPFRPQTELLMTVPGIQLISAVAIISEIGVDMSVFPTSKHLCSWAGLVPQNNESAGKKKTTRINRAGAYIKPLLVQCALAVCMSDKHPEIKSRYLALKKRRGHKKAIIAICRMLLTAIYSILKKSEAYNPELYRKETANNVPANRVLSVEQAIAFIQRQGYLVAVSDDGELAS